MKEVVNKIIFCILILCTIILLKTNSIGASNYLDLTKQPKDTQDLINAIYNFKQSLSLDLDDAARKNEITKKIIELCNEDLNKAKVFKYSYEGNNQILWRGNDNSVIDEDYISAKKAYESIEKANQNNTEVKIENTTQSELEKLEDEIYNMENNIKQMINQNVDGKLILNKVKELDQKIKEYNEKYGSATNEISRLMTSVDSWYNEYRTEGDDYQTAQDQAEQEREEREELNHQHGLLGTSTPNGGHTIDEVLNEAGSFIDEGKAEGNKISATNLKTASDTLYNILLGIGVFLAVAVGMYLGIKFMMSSAEEKAKVKEALIPYIAGCVVIFGAFVIWKLAITLLSGIA